ncbi:MAG: hypothetical protein WCW36_01295 [Candidatus Paceibacterota bacterium]
MENKPLFTPVATIELAGTKEKETFRCFTAGFARRDAKFDYWLSKSQPAAGLCAITVCIPPIGGLSFADSIRWLPGVEQVGDIVVLGRSLIASGYTMVLPQVEAMVKKTRNGEYIGFCVSSHGSNFFLVETGDPEEPVSIGCILCDTRDWCADIVRLGRGNCWDANDRLLVRNLDLSKFEGCTVCIGDGPGVMVHRPFLS